MRRETGRAKPWQRIGSLILALVLILGCMPSLSIEAGAAETYAQPIEKVADPSTQDVWGELVNTYQSTKYLGRIWSDKTVSADGVTLEYKLDSDGTTTTADSTKLTMHKDADFQVVLSTMSSSQSIKDQQNTPLDVVFILDISSSMYSGESYNMTNLQALVDSVNKTITEVQSLNPFNRVGVVLYYGGDGYTLYDQSTVEEAGMVLLELGRYTAGNNGLFVTLDKIAHSISSSDGLIKNGAAYKVRTRELPTVAGTYMQLGILYAMEQFKSVDDETEAGDHLPVFILMSDGEPTASTSSFAEIEDAEFGNNTVAYRNPEESDFVTQLTAAYAKAQVDAHYAEHKPLFYTLSLGTSVSLDVMDPGKTITITGAVRREADIKAYWDTLIKDGSVSYDTYAHQRDNTNKDTVINYTTKKVSGFPSSYDQVQYVDQAFTAATADNLADAFESIFVEIEKQAAQAPTHVGDDAATDGYVTLFDELGDYMEIKSVDALAIEGEIYYYNSIGSSKTTATTADYTETTYTFSKEVSLNTILAARASGKRQTVNLDDVIIIERDYKDEAMRDTLTVKVPASMLPLRYYSVDTEGNLTIRETLPIRVVYSVGLRDVVRQAMTDGIYTNVNGLTKYIENHTNVSGQILFYSNYFDGKDSNGDGYIDGNSYSTFAPAQTNSFYYYTEDTPFYKLVDGAYVPVKATGTNTYQTDLAGTVYVRHTYYKLEGGKTTQVTEYTPVDVDAAIKRIGITWSNISTFIGKDADGNYYMKKGYAKLSLANDVRFIDQKTENTTGTSNLVMNPNWDYNTPAGAVPGTDYKNYTTKNHMGNNGRLTYVARGSLKLEKALAEGDKYDGTFELTLTESTGTLSGTFSDVTFTNGVAKVNIKPGKDNVITINGLPAGSVISVTETAVPGWTPTYSASQVTISMSQTASVTVTNDYNTKDVTFELKGTKSFTGKNFPGGTFTFRAQECNSTGTEVGDFDGDGKTNGAQATVTYPNTEIAFSPVTFTKPIDRYYLITEDSTTVPGVTTDSAKYLLHLVVTDNGKGELVLTETLQKWNDGAWGAATGLAFSNDYEPKETSITIGGTKTLEGRNIKAGEFSFQLIDAANSSVTLATATNDADGNFSFPAITYTSEDMGGETSKTFTYYVREVNAGAVNMTYDATLYQVDVKVEDVKGELVATKTVTKFVPNGDGSYPTTGTSATAIEFENTYKVPETSVTLTGQKTTGGAGTPPEGMEFTYTAYEYIGGKKGNVAAVGKSATSGPISFGPINYTLRDMDGVELDDDGLTSQDFTYLVVEDKQSLTHPNMYFDPAEYVVTVTVTYDSTNGTMSAKVTKCEKFGADGKLTEVTGITYENIQNPPDVQIKPIGNKTTKDSEGNLITEDVSFSFSVINTVTGEIAGTGVGPANGTIQFSTMSFSETGTFTYWIVENNAARTTGGITYDATRYLMEVEVSRNATNELVASITYYASAGEDGSTNVADYTVKQMDRNPSFENIYSATGSINLTASKILEGRKLNAGEFGFKLFCKTTGTETSGIVGEDGTVTFATIHFTDKDVAHGESVVYTYTMTEVIPTTEALPGVTYDPSEKTIYIKLTNDDGVIKAELVANEKGEAFPEGGNPDNADTAAVETGVTFKNSYTVKDTKVVLSGTKELTGRDLEAGEFFFNLERKDGDTWKPVGTASNAADGSFSFTRTYSAESLSLTAFDANNQFVVYYRITEVDGKLGGITYDTSIYYAKVIITHDVATASYKAELAAYYTDEACTQKIDTVVFENDYDTNDVTATPEATKVLLGAGEEPMEDRSGFTFVVIETNEKGEPMKVKNPEGKPDSNKVVSTGTSDTGGNVAFSPIYYSEENGCAETDCGGICGTEGCEGKVHTHYYLIQENVGTNANVTYDTTVYYMTVTLHDDGQGKLTALKPKYYSDKFVTELKDGVVFTNHYGSGTIDLSLELTKAFSFLDEDYILVLKGAEFDFAVYSDEDCTKQVTVGDNGPTDENGVAKIDFGSIVITWADMGGAKEKDFVYYVKELPHEGGSHIKVDDTVIKVTAHVTDDGYGNLSATYTYSAGTVTASGFTNTYIPEGTKVVLDILKELTGKTLTGEKFTFELQDASGKVIDTVQNDASGLAKIELAYEPEDMKGADRVDGVYTKTFTYTLREVAKVENGATGSYTYDKTVYDVTVTLTDDGSGKLAAQVSYSVNGQNANSAIFRNDYTPKPVDVAFRATKTLSGKPLTEGAYSFVLKSGDTVIQTVRNDAAGNVAFKSITFDKAGTYTYTISEVVGDESGVVYDTKVYTVTVTVTDDTQGNLVAGVVYKLGENRVNDPVFTNDYDPSPASVVITAHKTLEGRTLENEEFTFQLWTQADFEAGIAGKEPVATATNDADGDVVFGALSFDEVGTYTYILVESAGEPGTITYDETAYTVTVTVTDEGYDGQLEASVAYSLNGEAVKPEDVEFENIHTPGPVKVTLSGTKKLTGRNLVEGEFQFVLMDEAGNVVQELTHDAAGNLIFSELTFDKAGTYNYTLQEVTGEDDHITYDRTVFGVTVTVTNTNGVLNAQVKYSADSVIFENKYTPDPVKVPLSGTKTLTGRNLLAGEFKFELVDEDGNVVQMLTHDAAGNLKFTELTFDEAGVFTYTVREVKGDDKHIAYDGTVFTVTVTVTRDAKGVLTATVDYHGKPIHFENKHTPDPISVTPEGNKVLTGKALTAGEFKFKLVAEDGTEYFFSHDANGKLIFPTLSFSETGTYTYTLQEVKGDDDHITYDTTVYTVTVTVTDKDKDGVLEAQVEYSVNNELVKLVAFHNTYKPDPISVTPEGNKVLVGKALADGQFTFKLVDEDGKEYTFSHDENGKLEFPTLTFSETGTYTYTVYEVKGADTHITYDEAVYTVTVTVTDENNDGVLEAQVTYSVDGDKAAAADFRNIYKPDPITVIPEATKTITGKKLTAGEFKFVLVDQKGNSTELTHDAAGNLIFPALTFDAVGTYTYTLREVAGDDQNIEYDRTVYTVTVTVTDSNNDGVLESQVVYSIGTVAVEDVIFRNTYTPDDIHVVIEGDKELTGKALAEDAFTFVMEDQDGNVIYVTNAADGSLKFPSLTFEKPGVYTYTIREIPGTDSHVTYDPAVFTVAITVTADDQGVLHAMVNYHGKPVVFRNTHTPDPITVIPEANKVLWGRALTAGEFTFELVAEDGTVIRLTHDGVGNLIFPALTFEETGTYTYILREVPGTDSHITYDSSVYTVTVFVTDADNDGVLEAQVVYTLAGVPVKQPVFQNLHTPDPISVIPEGTKVLVGKDLTAGEFTFELVAEDGTVIEVTHDADGNLIFPELTFEAIGTYTYVLREVQGTDSHITYDRTLYTVTVFVTDANNDGVLEAQVAYSLAGVPVKEPVFHNIHTPDPIPVIPEGTKTLTGKDLTAGEFTFELVAEDGTVIELTHDADGNLIFPELIFEETGTYTYILREVQGTDSHITYDETVYILTVIVTDADNDGVLEAQVAYSLAGVPVETPVFHNHHTPDPIPVIPEGTKTLTGKDLTAGEFTFELVAEDGTVIELTHDADGNLIFPELIFTEPGEYTYTVREVIGEDQHIAYDQTVFTFTVTVTQDAQGVLHATVDYHGKPVDFQNVYTPDAIHVVIEGEKELVGKELTEDAFTFVLEDQDRNIIEVTNAADGSLKFPALTFDKPGTYTYTVREIHGDDTHITYDDAVYTVTVTVTQDAQGVLHATVDYHGEDILFCNIYTPDPVDVVIEGEKELVGKELTEDAFTFVLEDQDGNIIQVTNAADGSLKFPALTFHQAGTYTYTVREVKGDDAHITYDDAVYTVTVTVTQDAQGILHAAVDYHGESVVFHNVHTPDPIDVVIEGEKDLTGKDLTDGEFTFRVKDAEGNLITTGTNAADGTIRFAPFQVTGETEMILYVSEVKGTDNTIEYDDYVYRVKLVVTNENGQLKATLTNLDGAIIFYNTYHDPISPDTGDQTPVMLYTGLMVASVLAMAWLTLGTRKKTRKFF